MAAISRLGSAKLCPMRASIANIAADLAAGFATVFAANLAAVFAPPLLRFFFAGLSSPPGRGSGLVLPAFRGVPIILGARVYRPSLKNDSRATASANARNHN